MNKPTDERPNVIPWPPMVYVAAILVALALGFAVPLAWLPPGPLTDILFMLGILMIAGGIALDLYAISVLHRHKTTVMPNRAVSHIVTSGPYALSRNPIYLGETVLMIGTGLFSGNVWFIVLAFIASFAVQKLAIEREEKHLEHKFQKAWRDYAKRVKRWI